MKITLVTASFNEIVHGTFNDKKTGCGINLIKPDTASRYHRSGQMTDLGEITCEKCKSKIAKEIIKADSKEMKALLKQERIRAKKGLDDENLVELSKLEVRPTGQYTEPEPEVSEPNPVSSTSANMENPAYTDDLAQFAIKKPQSEPENTAEPEQEDDFLNQFAIKKPQEEPVTESEPESDFLAQFAIQKTDEIIPAESISDDDDDDFLAQFSVSSPSKADDYEEPEKPPVIDDISSLEAIQKNPAVHTSPEYDEDDDILSMFSLESKEKQPENISMYDYNDKTDLRNIPEFNKSVPEIEDISASIPDDLNTPEIEDISIPILDDFDTPEIEDISAPILDDFDTPEIEDISAPVLDDFDTPEIEDISAPVLDDFDTSEIEDISAPVFEEEQEIKESVPVIDDISDAITALNVPPAQQIAPTPVQQFTPPPVQHITPQPVQQFVPPPVQYIAPQPVQTMGQIMSVPQLTGYDQNGQPIYTYVQMQLQGYDQNGQPIFVPILEQSMPMPSAPAPAPTAPTSSIYNKNTRLQEAIAAAQEIPTSSMNMTPGQRIAAAEAAKGSPVSANVSKIATNPHARSTSQAFISAISESKEYANQSLTETQGLKPKTNVLGSIEDVLSQLGDNSLKEKKEAEAKLKQNVPAFEEYKAPPKRSSSFSSPVPSSSKSPSSDMMDIPLSKADQKALKKQQKIDAKFQKKMEKNKK